MELQYYIRALFYTTLIFATNVCEGAKLCRPLSALPGTVVQCDIPSQNRTLNCLDASAEIPRGSVAKYKCERDKEFSENVVKCKCRGKWGGLRIFNDFMSHCNISDYSLNGPAELNLTEREIRQLSLAGMQMESLDAKDFQDDGVAYHNYYRRIHHSPALKLNKTLSDAAQQWAEEEADKNDLKTQSWTNRWYSQNLYRITGFGIDSREAVRLAVAAWYQGAYRYNWETSSGQSAFTQVVWKSTSDVGIGVAQKGNQTVVVANYWPPGNVVVSNPTGDVADRWAWFRLNVLPPNPINDTLSDLPVVATTKSPSSTVLTTTTEVPASTSS